MAKRQEGILREIRDEAKRQLRGFPRELKHRGFGSEAKHQLGHGWGEEFARQIFGGPKRRRNGR